MNKRQFINEIEAENLNSNIIAIPTGAEVCIKTKIQDEEKIRFQSISGIVISSKGGMNNPNRSITIRTNLSGQWTERTYQLNNPTVDSVVIKKLFKVRKSKMYNLRGLADKKIRLKQKLSK